MQEIQKLLKNFLDAHKIRYYLDCGTLLGAVRDKNFIKGDTDIDIQVPQQDLERLRENSGEYMSEIGILQENNFWENRIC